MQFWLEGHITGVFLIIFGTWRWVVFQWLRLWVHCIFKAKSAIVYSNKKWVITKFWLWFYVLLCIIDPLAWWASWWALTAVSWLFSKKSANDLLGITCFKPNVSFFSTRSHPQFVLCFSDLKCCDSLKNAGFLGDSFTLKQNLWHSILLSLKWISS